MIIVNDLRSGLAVDRRLAAVALRGSTAAVALGHLHMGAGLMVWRLRRTYGMEPAWAEFDELDRHWSWTTDETKAFVAHNPFIMEALQRRAPDWLRWASVIEFKPSTPDIELEAEQPVSRLAIKREEAAC